MNQGDSIRWRWGRITVIIHNLVGEDGQFKWKRRRGAEAFVTLYVPSSVLCLCVYVYVCLFTSLCLCMYVCVFVHVSQILSLVGSCVFKYKRQDSSSFVHVCVYVCVCVHACLLYVYCAGVCAIPVFQYSAAHIWWFSCVCSDARDNMFSAKDVGRGQAARMSWG